MDFCHFGDDEQATDPCWIGLMRQKAHLKLDEKGTEAAAVTVIEMTDGVPQTIEFHANRPFFYVISEQSTGVILFMGQYMGEDATGVDPLRLPLYGERSNAVYNLQGQRMNGLLKGLNIVDGKKYFVK